MKEIDPALARCPRCKGKNVTPEGDLCWSCNDCKWGFEYDPDRKMFVYDGGDSVKEIPPDKRVRVKWASEYGIGITSAEDTHCCELMPSWYVVFEGERPWEGHYFYKKDLEVIE